MTASRSWARAHDAETEPASARAWSSGTDAFVVRVRRRGPAPRLVGRRFPATSTASRTGSPASLTTGPASLAAGSASQTAGSASLAAGSASQTAGSASRTAGPLPDGVLRFSGGGLRFPDGGARLLDGGPRFPHRAGAAFLDRAPPFLDEAARPSWTKPRALPGRSRTSFLDEAARPSWTKPRVLPGRSRTPFLDGAARPSWTEPRVLPGRSRASFLDEAARPSERAGARPSWTKPRVLGARRVWSGAVSRSCSGSAPAQGRQRAARASSTRRSVTMESTCTSPGVAGTSATSCQS